MIVVAPPQYGLPPAAELLYVLLCEDAEFVLTFNESLRATRSGQAPFQPWHALPMSDQARALAAVRHHHITEELIAHAA